MVLQNREQKSSTNSELKCENSLFQTRGRIVHRSSRKFKLNWNQLDMLRNSRLLADPPADKTWSGGPVLKVQRQPKRIERDTRTERAENLKNEKKLVTPLHHVLRLPFFLIPNYHWRRRGRREGGWSSLNDFFFFSKAEPLTVGVPRGSFVVVSSEGTMAPYSSPK